MRLTTEEKLEFARRIARGNKTWNSGDSECNRLAVGPDKPKRGVSDVLVIDDIDAFEWLKELLRGKS